MKSQALAASVLVVASLSTRPVHADRVHLKGGTVLDGDVEKKGGKVIVKGEAGTIAVPQDSVLRIESAESAVARYEAGYAALKPGDVKGRMALADFCRANDLKASERRVLLEVIALEPENAAARARLGHVRTESGWVTEADAMRARGLVLHDGRWTSESSVREVERMRGEVAAANRQNEEAELARKRAQLAADQAAFDAERAKRRLDWGTSTIYPPYVQVYRSPYPYAGVYGSAYGVGGGYGAGFAGDCYGPSPCYRPGPPPVRHHTSGGPFDTTTLSVVKVPYRNP